MDLTDDLRQHLLAEKDKFKQKILENLTELYFLRNDGLMCDYLVWAAKEKYSSLISNTRDEDILNDQKFSQLLNLKFDEPSTQDSSSQLSLKVSPLTTLPVTTVTTTTATTTTATTSTTDSSGDLSRVDVDTKRKRSLSSEPDEAVTLSLKDNLAQPPEKKLREESPVRKIDEIRSHRLDEVDNNRLLEASNEAKLDEDLEVTNVDKVDQKSTSTQPKDESPTRTFKVVVEPSVAASVDTVDSHGKQTSSRHDKHVETPLTANVVELRKPGYKSSNSTADNEAKDESKRKSSQISEVSETGLSLRDGTTGCPEKRLRESSPLRKDETCSDRQDDRRLKVNNEVKIDEPEVINIDEINQKSIPTQAKDESPTRISKVVEPIVTPSAATVENHNKQLHERAKHEAWVTARIAELRKKGLWSAKKLPKLQDPPRPKSHWDFLLEEMRWMATDFDAEKKWKRKAAKKCAIMVYRYHQEKRAKEERLEREKLQHIKKLAASQAKEIRSFWSSIEKIVDFRQQTKLEETRKKAWGLHLNYILDQTSKFSNTCLEDTNNATKDIGIDYLIGQVDENAAKEPVINNEEQTKPKHEEVDDIAAGAQSIQPKGNTLETTTVSTKVPFLLKHSLREYQHIGLDWLVAMYSKKLNGILADEMGLGKTIQTIALLAHLACEKNDWGPHLIVVPTSVMLNWEMEFKKWCPAFKILTYYGNPKERKMKRVGWSRPNSFHVCITSYRIVIQDHAAFRRKKWCYFILDEAHYIKNFKSQRWQMLLNFNSQRRLLLTGTPLQNDLMELWSLMHFLMPNLFDSYREFKDWFVNPLTGMIEGSHEYNQELVQRLHKILRPFLLRRLKADVEKQLPRKREFIKTCRLSKRQRFLYEEFMSLSKTKETLASGNFLSVINVLMQLRKVCNHPNLFEPRPTISPFLMRSLAYNVPGLVTTPLDYNYNTDVNLSNLQLLLVNIGNSLTSFACDYIRSNKIPQNKLLEVLDGDNDSESSSQTIEDISVQEVEQSLEAIKAEKITEAYTALKEVSRAEKRSRLNFMSAVNDVRCEKANSLYFSDLRDRLYLSRLNQLTNSRGNVFSNGKGKILCSIVQELREKPTANVEHLTSLLDEAIRSPEQVLQSMADIIDRFVFCVPGVSAPPISMHVSHYSPTKKMQEVFMHHSLYEDLSPRFNFLNKIVVSMRTSFPELRLIEYDCGKLQTLSRLLNELKSQDHRVLIFTQMSRMLDILEQFLNYHGHTYLRLDGATKIDQRQILMERFNNDRRIFCFILSTRSGGIGVNLTGADTVIFYDSDWNPTMDAQAQDRCHRIGQTRDVHIYRLISEDTIEKNIFTKAQQKQRLGDLAIEEGNFNTSSTKRSTIHDLFNVEPSNEPIEVDKVTEVNGRSGEMTKAQLQKLEQALSKGEADAGEDMDVDAIKVARADVDTDLREFDESIPINENADNISPVEKSEKELQIDTIVNQMTPVERYAVNLLESLQKPKNKEELEQAEMEYRIELENKKSQWEQSRIEMLKEQSTTNNDTPSETTMLTYPRGAKCDHVQYLLDGERTVEEMPLWAPPTPPTSPPSPVEEINQFHYQPAMTPAMAARINAMGGLGNIFGFGSDSNKTDVRHFIDEKDLYIDYTTHFLYEPNIMLESQLPPVNQQYTDNEATNYTIGSKKIRLNGTPVVPGGYFQTPTQLPHLQQHLQNLTNIQSTLDANSSTLIGQPSARKPKVRRDEVICLPKSIFDRQTPNFAKIRRELKLQKLRCVTKGNDSDPFAMQKFFHTFSLNPLGQSLQQETIVNTVNRQMQQFNNPNILLAYHQDQLPSWTTQEEWALIMVIQHLQDLPVNLCILTPGHTPNWELVSEVISDIGFTHRSFKMCEYHFALTIQKREMTRDSSWDERAMQSNSTVDGSQPPAKKSKKHKNQQPSSDGPSSQQSTSSKNSSAAPTIPFKPSKTGSMLAHDKSLQIYFSERYDIIKRVREKRPKHMRARYTVRERQAGSNLVRDDSRLIDYERPLKPETVIREQAEERKRRILARAAAANAQTGHLIAQQQQHQVHQQQSPIVNLQQQPSSLPRPPLQSPQPLQQQTPPIQPSQLQPPNLTPQPQAAPALPAPQYNPYFYPPSK